MIKCPCGQEKKLVKQYSLTLRKEVEVLLCLCKREREVVPEGDLRFINSAHDKFVKNANEL